MKIKNGPIILGTIVMEKLGAVNFEHAFLGEYGDIEVMLDKEAEKAIKKETNFWPLYAVLEIDNYEEGTWCLCGALDVPVGMALDYPANFSFRIPEGEITMALNILEYGLDTPHVRKSLEQWAVKRLAFCAEESEKEDNMEDSAC